MSKDVNKKILCLFFVIVALIPFGSNASMQRRVKNEPRKPSMIEKLPRDCWSEIFKFCDPEDIELSYILRCVCKDFEEIVKSRPLSLDISVRDTKGLFPISFKRYYKCLKRMGKPVIDVLKSGNDIIKKDIKFYKLDRFGFIETLTLRGDICSFFNKKRLKRLENLQNLTIFHSKEFIVKNLQALPNLKTLIIDSVQRFIGEGLQNLPELQVLAVRYCNFNDMWLKNSTKLHELMVSDCSKFTGEGLQNLPELQGLVVIRCDAFNEGWLKNSTKLHELVVRNCSEFTGEGLQNLPELQRFTVIRCDAFNEGWLKNLQELQKFEVHECPEFTGKALQNVPQLQELKVGGWCPKFYERLRSLGYEVGHELISQGWTGQNLQDLQKLLKSQENTDIVEPTIRCAVEVPLECSEEARVHDEKSTWSKKRTALVLVPTVAIGAGLAWYLWKKEKEPMKTVKNWLQNRKV